MGVVCMRSYFGIARGGKSGDIACSFYFNELSTSTLVVSDCTEIPPSRTVFTSGVI